ncbi:MAG: hypothetical protein ACR2QK_16090 [Acidimicrobiales bacterium]
MTGWEPGDRPGDVLRVVAALDVELDDPETVDAVLTALGLGSVPDDDEQPEPEKPPDNGGRSRWRDYLRYLLLGLAGLILWPAHFGLGWFGVAALAVGVLAAVVAGLSGLVTGWVGLVAVAVTVVVVLVVASIVLVLAAGLIAPEEPRRIVRREPIDLALVQREPAPEPAMTTLVAEPEARSVAQSLNRTTRPTGRPDVEHARREMERGRSPLPLVDVREPRPAAATQALVDVGDSMGPLRDDVDQVMAALVGISGPGRLEKLAFKGSPASGVGPGSVIGWLPYNPGGVEPGTRVIVFSDAGLGAARQGRGRDDVWIELAAAWAERGATAVLVTPYPASDHPDELTELMAVVHWQDRLTARQVSMAIVGGS